MTDIDVFLTENRKFDPPPEFKRQANVSSPAIYEKSARDQEKFWAEQAGELEWIKPWKKVLAGKAPFGKRRGIKRPSSGKENRVTRVRSRTGIFTARSRSSPTFSRSSEFAKGIE